MKVEFLAKSFNGKEMITEEEKNYCEQIIYELVKDLSKEMNISNLEAIIIPDNYKKELFKFQKSRGLSEWCTDDDIGSGMGQTINRISNGKGIQTIFLRKELIAVLEHYKALLDIKKNEDEGLLELNEDEDLLEITVNAMNVLHHELSHVHEMNITENIKWTNNLNFDDNLLNYRCRELAMIIWREYYACRFSSETHKITSSDTDYIIKLSNKIETEILSQKEKYNLKKIELNDFDIMFHKNISVLLKLSASAHGNYFFLTSKNKRDENISRVWEGLKGTLFQNQWIQLGVILDRLFSQYPNWDTIDILDDLCNLTITYMQKFNIYIDNTPEGLYYRIM
ncbi:hypothetical protein [Clostridium botulinum]|uniref:hypothetical protein n=1 Tax=Clostridium botulinum TaxID=1491 RepID=UPI003DA3446D